MPINLSGLELSREQRDALVAHALATSPEECCGVLLGREDQPRSRVAEVAPAENVAPAEERRHRFHIDPAWLASVQRRARGAGLEIVGYYHSHPEGAAHPSDHDAACALSEVSTVIVGLGVGEDPDVRCWRWSPSVGRYEEERLVV